jgi:glycoprotein endo-alpha-1,2-mannosidase
MKNKSLTLFILSSIIILTSCMQTENITETPDDRVHTFYYNWYGNPEHDGEYFHWAHDILPHWSDTTWDNATGFPGADDIGANYYPELGCYSSNDTSIISKHMDLIQQSGIGALAITWWGINSYEDKSMPLYLDIANRYGLKIIFHIEPFYKTAEEFREQIEYITKTYGEHPALYTYNDKPFYYVYDSYKLSPEEWQKILTPDAELSLRNTPLDATFIGLWVEENDGEIISDAGFDGFYTYFASDGFVYGSTTANWQQLSAYAEENNLIFIPCAGPGYIDTRIRPWNEANTKDREMGEYYEKMFTAALNLKPKFIGITSFNEWHEGTQIESAIVKEIPGYQYEDYGKDTDPHFYITKTRELINRYEK